MRDLAYRALQTKGKARPKNREATIEEIAEELGEKKERTSQLRWSQ